MTYKTEMERLVAEMRMLSRLGGSSASVAIYDAMLSGERPIGKSSLAMSAYEGRDYIQEIREKRNAHVLARMQFALQCQEAGFVIAKMAEYRKAVADILP